MKVSCRTSSFTNTRNSLITISYRYLNLLLLFGEKTDACCLRFEHQKAFKKSCGWPDETSAEGRTVCCPECG